ncbi:MAG: hypothetical protein ACXWQ5_00475 [Ktedonobacterales bacterium]
MDEGLLTSLTIIVSLTAWLVARYFYSAQKERTELDRERLRLDARERVALMEMETAKAEADKARYTMMLNQPQQFIERYPVGRLN